MSRYTAAAGPSNLQRRERTTLSAVNGSTTSYTAASSNTPYSITPAIGVSPIPSGRNSPFPRPSSRQESLLPQWSREQGFGGRGMVDDLEGRNDERLEGLVGKVKMLKDLSYGIGKEVRESAIQLTEMNDAFAETGGILSGTFRRLNKMSKRQGGNWCWFIMFLVLVFWIFLITWWFRR